MSGQVRRCAGCGCLLGGGYASVAIARTPDGHGLLCQACGESLARALVRRGVDLVDAWRGWERGFYSAIASPTHGAGVKK